MWQRYLIASVGGAAITIALLYGMSEVAELFTRRSPTLYYRVMDFIPGASGPRRPELILPAEPPRRPRLEHAPGASVVIEAAPEFAGDESLPAPRLQLERSADEPRSR